MTSEEDLRLRIEIAILQQERDDLRTDNERISEAWCQVVQRQQLSDNAHDYDMRQVEAENQRLRQQLAAKQTECDSAWSEVEYLRDNGNE